LENEVLIGYWLGGCAGEHWLRNVRVHGLGAICGGTTITLQSPNDAWTAGTYSVALSIAGTAGQCSLQMPDPPPAGGVHGNCGSNGNTLDLIAVNLCRTLPCNGVGGVGCVSMSCTPIPGRFQMKLGVQGTPAQVGLALSLDGSAVMSETIAPKFTTTEPNGMGCGFFTNGSATVSVVGG
jgi:hypothetical protein